LFDLRDSAPLEGSFNRGHGEEELVGVIRKFHKLMVKIEGAGGFVQSFDYNANGGYFGRISPASVQGIHQEEAAQVLAPP
jgi:hypothetical protein